MGQAAKIDANSILTLVPAALLLVQGILDTDPDADDGALKAQLDASINVGGELGEAISDVLIDAVIGTARWLQRGRDLGKVRVSDLVTLLPVLGRLVQGVMDTADVEDDDLIDQLDEMLELSGLAELISDVLIRGVVKVGRWVRSAKGA